MDCPVYRERTKNDMKREDYPRLEIPPGLKKQMVAAARQFRKSPTPSEALLWQALRSKKLDGVKFRRQQPIGPFVVDFYAPAHRLIVEIDGPVHAKQQEADRARQELLEMLGLRFVRVSSVQAETNLPAVLARIREVIASSLVTETTTPSPLEGV